MLKLLLFGLFYLTQGCPPLGGDAVYEARALLAYRTDLVFDDESICSTLIPAERSTKEKVVALLSPNPTGGLLFIPETYLGANGLITDQYGRAIRQITHLQSILEVQDLQSGVYYLTLLRDNEANHTLKFVVIKP